jgi:hypothetical protein
MLDKVWVRYENEIMRMAEFEYAAIVAECDWQNVFRAPPSLSKLCPKTIIVVCIEGKQKFWKFFWVCPNQTFREKFTYRI